MKRIRIKANGAILLGENISCDGFCCDRRVRVQTHIHHDHMVDFNTSKANQIIVMSNETRELLNAIHDADLPYRNNIIGTDHEYQYNDERIELIPNRHMLGSVQVAVTLADGYRVGYSSDFFWPLDEVIQVDELIVDATYGDPARRRKYQQADVDACLNELVSGSIRSGTPTVLVAYNGRLQEAFNLMDIRPDIPVICSPHAYPVMEVYRRYGYRIPQNLFCSDSREAIEILRRREMALACVTFHEQRHIPWLGRFKKVHLSAHMAHQKNPLLQYDNGDCCLAMTDHADFDATIEYVRSSGARKVWTDSRSGNAFALAEAIREEMRIMSLMLSPEENRGWG